MSTKKAMKSTSKARINNSKRSQTSSSANQIKNKKILKLATDLLGYQLPERISVTSKAPNLSRPNIKQPNSIRIEKVKKIEPKVAQTRSSEGTGTKTKLEEVLDGASAFFDGICKHLDAESAKTMKPSSSSGEVIAMPSLDGTKMDLLLIQDNDSDFFKASHRGTTSLLETTYLLEKMVGDIESTLVTPGNRAERHEWSEKATQTVSRGHDQACQVDVRVPSATRAEEKRLRDEICFLRRRVRQLESELEESNKPKLLYVYKTDD